ncbi:MAG: glycosyltransferase family 4 protein [Lachnospiraceae bacterium]|nr:glycosyltransferase family 4 protein [Lachnospiraceae bacterium]
MSTRILFGAGVYAKKYKALLEYLDMDFDYFTDNDASKWGTFLYGKKVIAPNVLKTFPQCSIIISSTHEKAIRDQLAGMGMDGGIVDLGVLYGLCEKRMSGSVCSHSAADSGKTILVDMYEGIGWGGTELWAANLAEGLRDAGYNAALLGCTGQPALEEQYEAMVRRIPEENTIMQMVRYMEGRMPFIFINNFAGCAFMAASIVKRKYPGLVKIVSVIHSDSRSLFDAYMMLGKYMDKIFCVSSQIRDHMQELYGFDHGSYYTREQPVGMDMSWRRKINASGALRIGYAARLVKQAKRADLLMDLIGLLEKKGMDYIFQIAGEGECSGLIGQFISRKRLQDKVQLMGRLPKSQMDVFWKGQDVFVNVSEYEGTSLSMLEAMGYGCVPVVTDVSGAREFISQEKNGCICDVGNMERIADCIAMLADNRELLKIYGDKCRRIVQERCNPKEYIKYWIEEVLGDWI